MRNNKQLAQPLPTLGGLESQLEELTHGAEDHDPIIHSFKNTQHLRIGVRDIVGRDDIQSTHRALSDVAEICLKTVAQIQFRALLAKHATRHVDHLPAGESGLVILAMGKLGGREPNYHSDLDVIFVYEPAPSLLDVLPAEVTLQFFFGQLAANITRYISMATRWGRLYELDSRLRPTGKSGSLAVSSEEFARYFQLGKGHLWERQALCKARSIFGEPHRQDQVMQLVHSAIAITAWAPRMADEIFRMRMQMQQNCSPRNLKRGVGGTVDIEFLTQMLQLKFARQFPQVVETGTFDAIRALLEIGALAGEDAQSLVHGYRLLRSVESRLRLLNTTARHDLPSEGLELEKLAYLLNRPSGRELESEVNTARENNRALFNRVFSEHGTRD